jgi:Xaa-Pro aminopeptidase
MLPKTGALALALTLALTATALIASTAAAQRLPGLPEAPVRYEADYPPAAFHRGRREAVMEALPRGSVAVVVGAADGSATIDDVHAFLPSPDLYYLTGTEEPGSSLLLAPGGVDIDGRKVREVLFVPPRSPGEEIWRGRRWGPERARRVLGVEIALDDTRFDEVVGALVSDATVKVLTTSDAAVRGTLDRLRMVKAPEELVLLRRAVDITVGAHGEILHALHPGRTEYQIEALVEYTFAREGAERPGFPSIVGSGENTVLLHYDTNRRTTGAGDLVVVDVGASYHGYTADVTRTYPVDGTFTPEQRRVYEIVLEAQEAAIAAVRAGAPFGAPGTAASRVLARGLAGMGLLRDARDVAGLARFFPHGTSHYLGLEVHDVGTYGELAPGQVVTVEPGIYVAPAEDVDPRWWNIGVRIEDDVLVTDRGPVVLSMAALKDPDAIEDAMRGAVTR